MTRPSVHAQFPIAQRCCGLLTVINTKTSGVITFTSWLSDPSTASCDDVAMPNNWVARVVICGRPSVIERLAKENCTGRGRWREWKSVHEKKDLFNQKFIDPRDYLLNTGRIHVGKSCLSFSYYFGNMFRRPVMTGFARSLPTTCTMSVSGFDMDAHDWKSGKNWSRSLGEVYTFTCGTGGILIDDEKVKVGRLFAGEHMFPRSLIDVMCH